MYSAVENIIHCPLEKFHEQFSLDFNLVKYLFLTKVDIILLDIKTLSQANFCFRLGCQHEPNFLFISHKYEDPYSMNTGISSYSSHLPAHLNFSLMQTYICPSLNIFLSYLYFSVLIYALAINNLKLVTEEKNR